MVDMSREYNSWIHMHGRCRNPRTDCFANYGGRGIKVCERWSIFENFLADMGARPSGLTLERIDNDGDYSPDNCVWATRKAQILNRRATIWVEIEGVRLCLKDWTRRLGVNYQTVFMRICRGGMSPIEALTAKPYSRCSHGRR